MSVPAFRVAHSICGLSGCSSVATVIGNDGQPKLWLKLHRGWPRMTNIVMCVYVCDVCVFPDFFWDCRRGCSSGSTSQDNYPPIKSSVSTTGAIPSFLRSCHTESYFSLQQRHADKVAVLNNKDSSLIVQSPYE